MIKPEDPTYPAETANDIHKGIPIRAHFAEIFMSTFLKSMPETKWTIDECAKTAVVAADALITALNRK